MASRVELVKIIRKPQTVQVGHPRQLEPPVKTSTFVMNKIKGRISAEPEVRADRVEELKAKIKSGEYQVDSQRLSKTMLEDALKEDMT